MSESNLVLSCRHLSILLRYVYPKDRLTCDLELVSSTLKMTHWQQLGIDPPG